MARPWTVVLAAAALVLVASPGRAEENRLSLVAKVVSGLTHDGEMLMGTLGRGVVYEIEPGAYEIGFDKGVASFIYGEPAPCVFTQDAQVDGQPTAPARFDFNVVTGIVVEDQGDWEGLKSAVVLLEGAATAVTLLQGDVWAPGPAFANIVSSLTADELRAAAKALRSVCPGAS
jgi:hypothetical protein